MGWSVLFNDMMNALLEFGSALFIVPSLITLYRDKMVRGVNLGTAAFSDAWCLWNLYYYPSLHQWLSLVGSICLCAANIAWTALAVYYTRKEHGGLFTRTRRTQ